MNRRGFLGTLIGGVVATAAVRTWPFRVFSFPSEIIPSRAERAYKFLTAREMEEAQLFKIGEVITIRTPQRFLLNLDREVFTVKSYNPKQAELIITRGI